MGKHQTRQVSSGSPVGLPLSKSHSTQLKTKQMSQVLFVGALQSCACAPMWAPGVSPLLLVAQRHLPIEMLAVQSCAKEKLPMSTVKPPSLSSHLPRAHCNLSDQAMQPIRTSSLLSHTKTFKACSVELSEAVLAKVQSSQPLASVLASNSCTCAKIRLKLPTHEKRTNPKMAQKLIMVGAGFWIH